MEIALTIVHVILSVILIAIVLFQSGSQEGLSGSIGGAAESFFGKNKARTMDAMLAKCTYFFAFLDFHTAHLLSYAILLYKKTIYKSRAFYILWFAESFFITKM